MQPRRSSMSDFAPEDEPVVLEAENIIHDAYYRYQQLLGEYYQDRSNASILSGLGAAAIVAGGMMSQVEAVSRFNFAQQQLGYLCASIGTGCLLGSALFSVKARLTKQKFK